MANALFIALIAVLVTSVLFYDPFKTPWIIPHRRETPLVPYSFMGTYLVILGLLLGGWFLLTALPSCSPAGLE
jgi:hypothetical protein